MGYVMSALRLGDESLQGKWQHDRNLFFASAPSVSQPYSNKNLHVVKYRHMMIDDLEIQLFMIRAMKEWFDKIVYD